MSAAPAVLSAEQQTLRDRLGVGARYDSAAAPHADLLLARQGTAYLLRKLQELSDEEFDRPSMLNGWSRRHLIALIGYNARDLALLLEGVRTGALAPVFPTESQRRSQIELASTLPQRALRHLVEHSAVHLNVEWRDLSDDQWARLATTLEGHTVHAQETAWTRAVEVWLHAVDLGNGGSFHDFPRELNDRIIDSVLRTWEDSGERLAFTLVKLDRSDDRVRSFGSKGPDVTGRTADLARWLTRGSIRGLSSSDDYPSLPAWYSPPPYPKGSS